jgi:hypothetical protein
MFKRMLSADFKRIRFLHLIPLCLAYCLLISTIYLCAHDSAWVNVPALDAGTWGFLPQLASHSDLVESTHTPPDAVACAAVAHTVFFPLLVLTFVYRLFFKDMEEYAARASFAHGVSRFSYVCSKLTAATIVLQSCYILLSIVIGVSYAVTIQPEPLAQVLSITTGKIALNCLVNESFIAFCIALFAWIRSGSAAIGVIFTATFVGLITQMAYRDAELPVHMGYWAKASGLTDFALQLPATLLFSIASFALCAAIAFVGIVRSSKW